MPTGLLAAMPCPVLPMLSACAMSRTACAPSGHGNTMSGTDTYYARATRCPTLLRPESSAMRYAVLRWNVVLPVCSTGMGWAVLRQSWRYQDPERVLSAAHHSWTEPDQVTCPISRRARRCSDSVGCCCLCSRAMRCPVPT
eukprot:3112553-Rhodomonas_salina.4